jgi:hypothetical protein
MEIIQLPRQQGKTARMLGWLFTTPVTGKVRVLLVRDRRTKAHVLESVRLLDTLFPAWRIATVEELPMLWEGRGDLVLGIDELDTVLTQLLGHPVALATLTPDHLEPRLVHAMISGLPALTDSSASGIVEARKFTGK